MGELRFRGEFPAALTFINGTALVSSPQGVAAQRESYGFVGHPLDFTALFGSLEPLAGLTVNEPQRLFYFSIPFRPCPQEHLQLLAELTVKNVAWIDTRISHIAGSSRHPVFGAWGTGIR